MKLKLYTMCVRKKFAWSYVVTHDKYLVRFRWYYSTGSYSYVTPKYVYESNSGLQWVEQSRWIDREIAESDAARWELIHLEENGKKGQ